MGEFASHFQNTRIAELEAERDRLRAAMDRLHRYYDPDTVPECGAMGFIESVLRDVGLFDESVPGSGAGYQSQGQATGELPPVPQSEGILTATPAGAPDVGGIVPGVVDPTPANAGRDAWVWICACGTQTALTRCSTCGWTRPMPPLETTWATCRWCHEPIVFVPSSGLQGAEDAWVHEGPQLGHGPARQRACEPDMQSMLAEPDDPIERDRHRIWAAINGWEERGYVTTLKGIVDSGITHKPLAPFFDELRAMVFNEAPDG